MYLRLILLYSFDSIFIYFLEFSRGIWLKKLNLVVSCDLWVFLIFKEVL